MHVLFVVAVSCLGVYTGGKGHMLLALCVESSFYLILLLLGLSQVLLLALQKLLHVSGAFAAVPVYHRFEGAVSHRPTLFLLTDTLDLLLSTRYVLLALVLQRSGGSCFIWFGLCGVAGDNGHFYGSWLIASVERREGP